MNNDFWGYVALGWFVLIAILLGYLIFFVTGIWALSPHNYNECISLKVPPMVCDYMFPPLDIQRVSN